MNNLIPFISNGKKKTHPGEGDIIDHGNLGKLSYEIYKRGVIHIFSSPNQRFKKDIEAFQEELDKMDFVKLGDGKYLSIKGSGDNPDILFTKTNGDVEISIKEKGFPTIDRLKEILRKKG